jgi:CDP-glucose 4,6-dehydratase
MGFWTGKRVFLTGHTGFKGSWMALLLSRLGADVFGYALRPPTEPNLFTVARVGDGMQSRIADIRDAEILRQSMADFAPDVVIHMAAQPLVRDSYDKPVETFDVNVMGTVYVLEAVRQTPGVKATIIVTSDKCYENREVLSAYSENDAMGGHDPYSSSKGCAELATAAYGRSFFAPGMGRGAVASVRAGNVIGGGDWAKDRLVADLARGLIANEPIIVRHPDAIRPWQHVLEPLSGYLKVAEHLMAKGQSAWEAWNFGADSGGEQSVGVLAALACRIWGRPNAFRVEVDPDAVHEAKLLKLDSTKARTRLGWRPRWGFEESVTETMAWYRAFADGADMRAVTLSQIETHQTETIERSTRRIRL